MSFPGTDAGAEWPVDPDLAKALSHPLRQRILERLNAAGEASPNELAGVLGAPLGNVAYHVRMLVALGCVELTRTRPRRGALEHYYRATAHPWLDAEQWANLPASFRRQALAGTLRDVVFDACEAGVAGGFDDADAQIKRVSVELDQQGWRDAAALLEQMLMSLERIHAESAGRASDGQGDQRTVDTEIAVLLFRRAPHPA
jgi:DNA-binding transcriptional ArsR family regulator